MSTPPNIFVSHDVSAEMLDVAAVTDELEDRVIEIVHDAFDKDPNPDDRELPKAERKLKQIEHASHLSHAAKHVKLADKTANLRDVAVGGSAMPKTIYIARNTRFSLNYCESFLRRRGLLRSTLLRYLVASAMAAVLNAVSEHYLDSTTMFEIHHAAHGSEQPLRISDVSFM